MNRKTEKKNYIFMFLIYNLFMILFVYATSILTSGYHLIDDHEVYTYGRSISDFGLGRALMKILADDMLGVTNSRFRFTYIIIRVLQIYILRDNFTMWHLAYAILTAVNMFLAYVFARRQECPVWLAFVFSIVIFVGGGQAAVIWRLGPQENLGLLILFLLLLYMEKELEKRKTVILTVLIILLGGIKESFLMLLPVLPIMMSVWDSKKHDENITIRSLIEAIKRNKIFLAITWLVFAISIMIIIFIVGTNNNGYAGVDASAGLKSILYSLYYVLAGRLKRYLLLSVLGVIILGAAIRKSYQEGMVTKKEIKEKVIIYGCIYGYIFATQVVLHLKSGMFERYLLPSVVAFAMMWMIDLYAEIRVLCMSGIYKAFLLLSMVALIFVGKDWKYAVEYAKDGADTTAAFSKVAELADKETKIAVGIGYEADVSASVYLQEYHGIDFVYNVFFGGIENGMIRDCHGSNSLNLQTIAITDVDIYVDYQGSLQERFDEFGINKSLCVEYMYGDYRILVK